MQMVSEEYIQQLVTLVDLPDSNYDKFRNKIQELKNEETIIIYGAGGCGEWLLELFTEYSVEVTAFIDNNPEKWNHTIKGIPVYSPKNNQVVDSNTVIIIALRNINDQQEVFTYLEGTEAKCIIPYTKIWNNFFSHPNTDIKEMFDINKLIDVAKLWEDKKSTDLFMDAIRFYTIYGYEMAYSLACGLQYFPNDIPLKKDYTYFIDCGAYTGDTIKQLQQTFRKPKKVIAFEPDTDNFLKLSQFLRTENHNGSDQFILYPCGVWSETTQLRFADSYGAGSAIRPDGESIKQFVALDDIIFNIRPTFIKMDIEGAEVEALQGAKGLICKNKPDLAICLYHKINHLWEIALLIDSWNLGYNFYIRQHDYTMEIVMYATVISNE